MKTTNQSLKGENSEHIKKIAQLEKEVVLKQNQITKLISENRSHFEELHDKNSQIEQLNLQINGFELEIEELKEGKILLYDEISNERINTEELKKQLLDKGYSFG